jgi:D-3-phosphoglycerate dehydrogenase
MIGLQDLLQKSDFVTLHCTLNPTSYHLINDKNISFMKQTAYLINTCRGPVVEEVALSKALHGNKIGGAALDVFEEEPLPRNSHLRGLSNCFLAPHNANSSPEAWLRVHENTINGLLNGLRDAG